MDVQRCKKCGCIFVEDEVICPTCGANNRTRKMFEDTTFGMFSFKGTESTHPIRENKVNSEENNEEGRRRKRILFLVLFALVVLPFKVIFGLVKEYSGKK